MDLKKLIGNYDESNTNMFTVIELLNNRHDIFSEEQVEKLDIVLEIVSEYLKYKNEDVRLSSPAHIFNAIIENYVKADITREHFGVVFFDNKMHMISSEILFTGTKDMTAIEIPTILRKAILLNAMGIAIIHNHPSGNSDPSLEDLELTRRFEKSCKAIEIALVDHIIIGGVNSFKSLREENFL